MNNFIFPQMLLAFLILAAPIDVLSAEAVLGLPLGKKIDRSFETCPEKYGVTGVNRLNDYCLDRQTNPDLLKTPIENFRGTLYLRRPVAFSGDPNYDQVTTLKIPSWVSFAAPMEVYVGGDGTIVSISAGTSGPSLQGSIIDSVTSRFGQPKINTPTVISNNLGASISTRFVRWEDSEMVVQSSCVRFDRCSIVFRTSAEDAAIVKRIEDRKNKDKL